MTRLGIGFVTAVALASAACTGSTRTGKGTAGSGEGKAIATAAEESAASGAQAAASAPADAGSAAGATKEVEGRVELIDRANNVTLAGTESVGHAFDRLKIDEDTEITVNGEEASLAEVHPGDEVRASFSGEGDELRVEKLEIVSANE